MFAIMTKMWLERRLAVCRKGAGADFIGEPSFFNMQKNCE